MPDEDAKQTYPDGWQSPLPYIRIVPPAEIGETESTDGGVDVCRGVCTRTKDTFTLGGPPLRSKAK